MFFKIVAAVEISMHELEFPTGVKVSFPTSNPTDRILKFPTVCLRNILL